MAYVALVDEEIRVDSVLGATAVVEVAANESDDDVVREGAGTAFN